MQFGVHALPVAWVVGAVQRRVCSGAMAHGNVRTTEKGRFCAVGSIVRLRLLDLPLSLSAERGNSSLLTNLGIEI